MANRKESANRAVAASGQLPKTVGALAGDDSADIADSGCAGSGTGVTLWSISEQVAQSRTGRKKFLTLFPEQKRIVNLRSR